MTAAVDEIERKWVVLREWVDWPDGQAVESDSYIIQTGLQHPDEDRGSIERVRHRRYDDGRLELTHTVKHSTGHPGIRKEIEREITEAEYELLLERRHPAMVPIRKQRRVFIYEGHTFEFDSFREPVMSVFVLECELPSLNAEVQLPPWLPVDREVTDEPGWTNTSIALNNGPPA